eukprot:3033700-Pleurochrysis_carterae.AAC.1
MNCLQGSSSRRYEWIRQLERPAPQARRVHPVYHNAVGRRTQVQMRGGTVSLAVDGELGARKGSGVQNLASQQHLLHLQGHA